MQSVGKLKKLDPKSIRKVWPHEEKDLSPWIQDNIDILNEVLGLEIQIEGREEYVHSFRLDMVGTDSVSKKRVIIENQFGKSDHDHLGKLITYSAGKEAGIMIWIANEIQAAHKEAIDWLNGNSPEEMTFYAVELELLQIDESKPAPYFRIVSGPPPSKRRGARPDDGEISPRNKRYLDFFEKLRSRVLTIQPNFARAKALPHYWWMVGIGRSGFSVQAAFTMDGEFTVELYIDTGSKEQNQLAFEALHERKKVIEQRIGQELVWNSPPDTGYRSIYCATEGTIDDSDQRLADLIEWATPLLLKFREVFAPLVKEIDIEE